MEAKKKMIQETMKKKGKKKKNRRGGDDDGVELPTIDLKKFAPGFMAPIIEKLSGDKKKVEAENLSYKLLHKKIVELHPTDPETFEKLNVGDSVSVSRYGLKMIDAIGCLYLI